MPKRNDIHKILLIGSGPIIIGQACEFDYSGTQACKALKEEGYSVVLVNSNPATIMTDPDMADRTYIEPLTYEYLAKIIERERPDALLPTVGGQTGLNLAVELDRRGILAQYGVELIGAKVEAIKKAEDRELFKRAMESIGLELPRSAMVYDLEEAPQSAIETIGFPAILRPSFTLGGTGGTPVNNMEEYVEGIRRALDASPVRSVLVEQSLIHWKEFELEIMRDLADNVVIICSIENFDPMGVHTGDSITVAPAQTLTDKEYQVMRSNAIKIIREIGVETGGSNIQFAVDPKTGRQVVIEMNPRVSRSSALASKATGFPIAKIAAKLAVGYTLDEIRNDITRETYASFEPTIDYCVVKFPRFSFEKFHLANQILHTQMQSVGEVMAIGRTFKESLLKAIRSLETGTLGLESLPAADDGLIRNRLKTPCPERVWYIAEAFRRGYTVETLYGLSGIDPWFLGNIQEIVEMERQIATGSFPLTGKNLLEAKQLGFSDGYLGRLTRTDAKTIRERRWKEGIHPVYKRVDTCAAEFVAHTPYLYSTYEQECEANPTGRKKIMILGSGPNRIGQGIEFDYCCVHASYALREDGFETIMVNCNPETVSTDYDTSDRLYFEPLTLEDVLSIVRVEKPDGVIVQFGGQTPLKLALPLEKAGVPVIGTSPDSIDRVEDRKRFKQFLDDLGFQQPRSGTATTVADALKEAKNIGYPIVVRPSYVLGGQAMEIVHDDESLVRYMENAVLVSEDRPVLIDQFLSDAIEFDVDAISDGETVVVGGIMEHVEEAGIHSGDSACMLPPRNVRREFLEMIRHQTIVMARELGVRGLINVQFAVKGNELYILEVNPRASRTIPFVSKSIGIPLAKLAARVMAGKTLPELGFVKEKTLAHTSVKESVLPFNRFPNVDPLLGPEMKSTGEVMGIDTNFGLSFGKATLASGSPLPKKGKIFISVTDKDKPKASALALRFHEMGFEILATRGTAAYIKRYGIPVSAVNKVQEGSPHIVDSIFKGEIRLVINTTSGKQSILDSYQIRRTALMQNVPYCTTIQGAVALTEAIGTALDSPLTVRSLQEYHAL